MHAYFDESDLRRRLNAALQSDRANMKAICFEIGCGEASMFEFLEGESVFENEVLRSLQSALATLERKNTVVGFGIQRLSDAASPSTQTNRNPRIGRDSAGFSQMSVAVLVALNDFSEKLSRAEHNQPPDSTDEIALLKATIASLEDEIGDLRKRIETYEEEKVDKAVKNISQHLEVFLDHFMPIAGRGTALLFIATATATLAKLGYDSDHLTKALERLTQDQ